MTTVDTPESTAIAAPDAIPAAAPKRDNPKLGNALADAQMLLYYACQGGITLDNTVIATVVGTATSFAAGTINDDSETAFWQALDTLSRAVSPVSVGSLRAIVDGTVIGKSMLGRDKVEPSLARIYVGRYTWGAIIALLLLLAAQIYWLCGTAIVGDIAATEDKYSGGTPSALHTGALSVGPVQTAPNATGNAEGNVQEAAPSNTPVPADATATAAPQDATKAAQADNAIKLKQHMDSSQNMLAIWSMPWQQFLNPNTTQNCWRDLFKNPNSQAGASARQRCTNAREAMDKNADYIARFNAATMVLEVLQRYVLPILYGLLGACVFVLRTLSQQITNRTYAEASNIDFRIRIYLGALSGLVFAWFITPDSANGMLKSLSPFALAFLAGYNVELLFAAMDRFLTAFTAKTEK